MAPIRYVYLVQRRDYEDLDDTDGREHALCIYADLQSANEAAKDEYLEQRETGDSSMVEDEGPYQPKLDEEDNDEDEEDEDDNDDEDDLEQFADKCFSGQCRTCEDERDSFVVWVEKMCLFGNLDSLMGPTRVNAPEPVAHPPALPLGGLRFVLTGSLTSMDREDAVKQLQTRGAAVVGVPDETTMFAVLGSNPAGNKLARLAALDVRVLNEEQFVRMLSTRDGAAWAQENASTVKDSGFIEPSHKRQRVG